MKKFVNKETEIKNHINFSEENPKGTEIKMCFADLALICLNTPPQKGWDKDSMKKSFKLESIFKKDDDVKSNAPVSNLKANDVVDLEDADFDYLYQRAQPDVTTWTTKHKDILSFLDYLDEIKLQK